MSGPDDLVRLSDGRLTALVDPLGAELHALRDGAGRDVLWDGDPSVWAGRAPVLFPVVGGLNGDRYRLDGRVFQMPRHGFARRRRFQTAVLSPAEAVFTLGADEATRAVYPFEFLLQVRFLAEGGALAVTATARNLGAGPMPLGLGLHPALRLPSPGSEGLEHGLWFDEDQPGPVRRLTSAGLLSPAPWATPIRDRFLALTPDLFAKDVLILDPPAGRGLRLGAAGRPGMRIEWSGARQLGLWSKPGAGFVCVEPWIGHADPAGYDGDFRDKPASIGLPPGGSVSLAMTLRPE